ncbi:MAG: CocE/NonD family hydrolase [Planctomycetota bacterium]
MILAPALLLLSAAPLQGQAVRRDVSIPMRDGKALLADVFLPPKPGKHACVLIQTPYGKESLGRPIGGDWTPVGEIGRGAVSDTLGILDRAHYAYVVVDWRGFHGSRAAMQGVDKRKWRRGLDGFDCVEWCAAQDWCNGKVGTWGGSALGKQQFDTAVEQPPHLVCAVPLIAAMGQRHEFYYEGGIYLEGHNKMLDLLGFGVGQKVRQAPLPDAPLWRFAKAFTYHPERIAVPCLLITGWWDHFPDFVIRTFEDVRSRGGPQAQKASRLLIGPWDHVGVGLKKQGDLEFPGAELASARAAKAFLDFHLRGVRNGWDDTPRVRYWQCGENRWHEAASWSGIPREEVALRLRGGTILLPGEEPPKREGEAPLHYTYDPRHPSPTLGGANLPPMKHGPTRQNALLDRKDQLVFRTKTLETPLELNGNAELGFRFLCNRKDCDFTARLCDEDEEGSLVLVVDAAQRARLRRGKVELLDPGKSHAIALRFPVTAYTFVPGHRLALIVSSGNWPRYERNPDTGAGFWDPDQALDVEVALLQDRSNAPLLKLPRRIRSED